MNKILSAAVFASCVSAYALPVNITSTVLGGLGDDQVSLGCVATNAWDLEATLLDGSKLSIVSSFNLKNGQSDGARTFTSGDIFIDIDGDATNFDNPLQGDYSVSPYNRFTNANVNYDYALKLDFTANKFTVFQLSDESILSNIYFDDYKDNFMGNPFQYVSGGTNLGTFDLTYTTGLTDNAALGYTSWASTTTHNMVTVDLANLNLKDGQEFTSHFTIGCGNDVAVGKGNVHVPEPASCGMILFGLAGLLPVYLRKRNA